jgi:DNA-binding transcriptional MerR regulator
MGERLWFKIGEAAEHVGVTPRDIRYWEKVIPELRPRRSKGNLRYYHRDSLPNLLAVSQWIKQGFAVADCRELLQKGYVEHGLGLDESKPETASELMETPSPPKPKLKAAAPAQAMMEQGMAAVHEQELKDIIDSAKALLRQLKNPIACTMED